MTQNPLMDAIPLRGADPRAVGKLVPATTTVVDRVLDWARREPGRPALVSSDRVWTYGELGEQIQGCAKSFPTFQAIPVFAVHGVASFGFVVALCAVMRAGAAVLPIDAGLPALRKRQMIEVSGAAVVLDTEAMATESAAGRRVLSIDAANGRALERGLEPTLPGLSREAYPDAAYVFLTSGTTAAPKAVLGRASSLDHFVSWERRRFAIGADDKVAQLTNLSFDPCLREIFVALTSGATLQLLPPGARTSGEQVLELLAKRSTTIAHVVPSLARHWLRARGSLPQGLSALRLSLFAGEPLVADLVRAWRALAPNSAVVNLYGPTETTLARFCWVVAPDPELATIREPLPVGFAIDDSAAVVVDDGGAACAAGAVGHILIDTRFPTYGYLDDDLTRVKFVELSGSEPQHGARFFRTGDLGYVDDQKRLVVAGRADKQIKIAGVRINPAEVAACIRSAPGVAEVVVDATNHGGGYRLVAWYVPVGDRAAPQALRAFLEQRLVPAMIPSVLVPTAALPVTDNGKVDVAALRRTLERAGGGERPQSRTDELVCRAWGRAFGTENVTLDDEFYAAGGDSLKATEIAADLARSTDLALTQRAIFQHSTPRSLASAIDAGVFPPRIESWRKRASSERHTATISPRQRAYRAVCMTRSPSTWCILSRIAALPGRVERDDMVRALGQLLGRHDSLRMAFPAHETREEIEIRPLRECLLDDVEMSRVDLPDRTFAQGLDRAMEIRAEGSCVEIDVSRWPPFRLARLRFSDRDALVLWVHHLVLDGPSLNIVVDDLLRALSGELDEASPRLEPTYVDYTEWCAVEESPRQEQSRAYWRGLLSELKPLALPERRGDGRPSRGMLFARPFPAGLVQRVLETSRALGCTPFVLLLGAFLSRAAAHAGRSDVSAIVPFQVRPEAFERTTGMFFSQLIVRVDASTVRRGRTDWVRALSHQILEGQQHPSYEFDRRLDDLGIDPSQYDFPLTTLIFNLNQVTPAQDYAAATPFGHHALGRDLRFQLQGEVQQKGGDFFISYLYRAGVFTTAEIERFGEEVVEAVFGLCAASEHLRATGETSS